jgi:hypothetical protein
LLHAACCMMHALCRPKRLSACFGPPAAEPAASSALTLIPPIPSPESSLSVHHDGPDQSVGVWASMAQESQRRQRSRWHAARVHTISSVHAESRMRRAWETNLPMLPRPYVLVCRQALYCCGRKLSINCYELDTKGLDVPMTRVDSARAGCYHDYSWLCVGDCHQPRFWRSKSSSLRNSAPLSCHGASLREIYSLCHSESVQLIFHRQSFCTPWGRPGCAVLHPGAKKLTALVGAPRQPSNPTTSPFDSSEFNTVTTRARMQPRP